MASGCDRMYFAPESGSPDALKRIKKKINPKKMLASMRASVRAGMYVKAHLISGLPDDTIADLARTFWFAVKMAFIGVHDVLSFPFVPYPGSALHDRLVKTGILDPNSEKYDSFLLNNTYDNLGSVHSWNSRFGQRFVLVYSLSVMIIFQAMQFVLRPWRLVSTVCNVFTNKPNTNAEKLLLAMIARRMNPGRAHWFRTTSE